MAEKREPTACDGRLLKANSDIQSAQYSARAFQSQHDDQPRKSGGRATRQKGNRAERALVRALQNKGFGAERVTLSGSAGGRFQGDVTVPLIGVDRREPLVVIPLALAVEIAFAAERNKGGGA